MDEVTRGWLASNKPWPAEVRAYLIDIGNQQKIIKESCGS